MKTLIIFCLMLSQLMTGSFAQTSEGINKEKMKAFAAWVGRWQGEGAIQMGPGEPKKSNVDEHIQSKLDGTVLLIEGIGKAKVGNAQEETVVHHALAILSYDPKGDQYKLNAHLKDGKSADAWIKIVGENKYQWGFDVPNGNIRYSITLDPIQKTWNEIGEFSRDGSAWAKFFEMNLKKTE